MDLELEQVCERWEKLTARERAAILVTAGVRDTIPARQKVVSVTRVLRGDVPEWLPTGLNLLRDSEGRISNREIARRLRISHTVLTRNQTFQRAREAYPSDGMKRHKPGREARARGQGTGVRDQEIRSQESGDGTSHQHQG